KDAVFSIDPEAFVIINDTLEVLGKRHGKRKVY
ncbi:MAG: YitT family protein, partial [Desulfacinum sp.]|nr:YitT family protein [Desulfacinum sp.]